MKNSPIVGLGLAIVSLMAILVVVTRDATRPIARPAMKASRTTELNQAGPVAGPVVAPVVAPETPEPLPPEPANAPRANPPMIQPVKTGGPISSPAPAAAQVNRGPSSTDAVISEPTARLALSFVGVDPDAEEVWYTAINDPNLSANVRQNLIEDLNEDGFADPRNPTQDELPLIVNRLLLIEDVALEAMDDVNAAAFAEAYKDLLNMYARLTGQ